MTDTERRPLTINGQQFRPTKEDVLAAMKGAPTRPLENGNWYIVVRGRRHPARRVVAATLGIPRSSLKQPHVQAFANYVGLELGQMPGRYVP